jgi:hypothetical protein
MAETPAATPAAAPADAPAPATDVTTTEAEAPAATGPVATPGIIIAGGVRYREEDAKRLGITADSAADAAAVADNKKPVGPQKKAGTTPAIISKNTASTK